jgi:hypothetical protein
LLLHFTHPAKYFTLHIFNGFLHIISPGSEQGSTEEQINLACSKKDMGDARQKRLQQFGLIKTQQTLSRSN